MAWLLRLGRSIVNVHADPTTVAAVRRRAPKVETVELMIRVTGMLSSAANAATSVAFRALVLVLWLRKLSRV